MGVQEFFVGLCEKVEGLSSIVVTDRDGVAILRAPALNNANEESTLQREQILTTIFSLTTEQTSKVKMLGSTNHIITMHDSCMILQGEFHT